MHCCSEMGVHVAWCQWELKGVLILQGALSGKGCASIVCAGKGTRLLSALLQEEAGAHNPNCPLCSPASCLYVSRVCTSYFFV